MENSSISEIIRKKFPALAEKELQEEITKVAKIMTFKEGDVILNYGNYVKFVPLIIKGSMKVSREDDADGREILLYFLTAGETCSMSFTCCMTDKRSEIRVEAEEDTTIIALPIQHVDAWMMKYRSWKNFVMQSYDNRMLQLVNVIDNIAFKNLDGRMHAYLKSLTKSLNTNKITRTHQEIAVDLNVSREAVSRLLKKLEQMGAVKLSRNTLIYVGA